jgi:hypothetical protein
VRLICGINCKLHNQGHNKVYVYDVLYKVIELIFKAPIHPSSWGHLVLTIGIKAILLNSYFHRLEIWYLMRENVHSC